jgi:hypothetical protein
MHIEAVPNCGAEPTILLRESYRDGRAVRKGTLLNLTHRPVEMREGFRALWKGGVVLPPGQEALTIERSLPHGHIAAVLGSARCIGLDRLLGPKGNRPRDLVLAMIVGRIIAPASKLPLARMLNPATAASSLGAELGLGAVDEDELYDALDWLHERQGAIETALARKRDPLCGAAEIGLKVCAVLGKHKMAKHFDLTVADARFLFARKTPEIAAEAALDDVYAVRTNRPSETIADAATVRAYKSLSMVVRAFRCIKTADLHTCPIHHWLAERVRAHVFLCMFAYHVEWHMRARLAPMLFDDDDKEAAETSRENPVAQAQGSPAAIAKQMTGLTADGAPVHSFRTLLADLATIARNTVFTALAPDHRFNNLSRPTPVHQKAFDLLAIPIPCSQETVPSPSLL